MIIPGYPPLKDRIKALTVSQPWASLIANGTKLVENRIWETSYRGWLAIHAGSGKQYLSREQLADYPTGRVIALARLVGCYRRDELLKGSISIDESQWPFIEGPFCWLLDVVARVDWMIPGKQGLWDLQTAGLKILQSASPLAVPDYPKVRDRQTPAAATPVPATVDRQRNLFGGVPT